MKEEEFMCSQKEQNENSSINPVKDHLDEMSA